MILFTGGGKIASAFQQKFQSHIVSARNLSDDELATEIEQAKTIIHNAALIYSDNFDELIAANFILTRRIVKICEEVNPDVRFINISTMSLLQNNNEYLPVDQMNDYAFSKYMAENYCSRSSLKELASLRFSTIFYGDPKRDGISKLIVDAMETNEITLFNNGEAKRDIIPLDILVQYLYKVCHAKELKEYYNIAAGEPTSFMEVATFLQKHNPALKIHNKVAETHHVLCDFSRADMKSLGEVPFDLEEEVNAFIKSYH